MDVIENDEMNIEDEIDLKMRVKELCEKMKKILKERERLIIELRFGLRRQKTKNTKRSSKNTGDITFLCIQNREKSNWETKWRNKQLKNHPNNSVN